MYTMQHPFPGQQPDEKIIMFIRRHWISFLGFIGMVFGMILIMFFFYVILALFFYDFFSAWISPLILLASAYVLFLSAFFLVGWIDYYFDIVIITDRRIIDIRQKGLFARDIYELDILHIEDVSAKTTGILPTIFRYGDVYVQTAGTSPNFTFKSVPNPGKISRQIMALYDAVLESQPGNIETIDKGEGTGSRHLHPTGTQVQKTYQKELANEEKFYEESLRQPGQPPVDNQSNPDQVKPIQPVENQSQDNQKPTYKDILKKDEKGNSGKLENGDEVKFDE